MLQYRANDLNMILENAINLKAFELREHIRSLTDEILNNKEVSPCRRQLMNVVKQINNTADTLQEQLVIAQQMLDDDNAIMSRVKQVCDDFSNYVHHIVHDNQVTVSTLNVPDTVNFLLMSLTQKIDILLKKQPVGVLSYLRYVRQEIDRELKFLDDGDVTIDALGNVLNNNLEWSIVILRRVANDCREYVQAENDELNASGMNMHVNEQAVNERISQEFMDIGDEICRAIERVFVDNDSSRRLIRAVPVLMERLYVEITSDEQE